MKNSCQKKGYVTKTNSINSSSEILVILLNRALTEKKLNQHIEFTEMLEVSNQSGQSNYNLKAVVEHIEQDFKHGHYLTFFNQDAWYEADDVKTKVKFNIINLLENYLIVLTYNADSNGH